jgi:hypothetical protein
MDEGRGIAFEYGEMRKNTHELPYQSRKMVGKSFVGNTVH